MYKLTKAQQKALKGLYDRFQQSDSYIKFRRNVHLIVGGRYDDGTHAVMVPWAGMYVAIEPDGHTHT